MVSRSRQFIVLAEFITKGTDWNKKLLGFPGGSEVKTLPAMQQMWIQSLGQEGPLEKAMVTHSSILAWEIPWMEEPGGLLSMGSQNSWT